MKASIFLFFFLPLLSLAQHKNNCEGLDKFWMVGTVVSYPKGMGTAAGFHVSENTMIVKEGFYLGGSADVMKFQDMPSVYVPLSLNITMLPLNKAVGPVLQLAPGYGFYRQTVSVNEKSQTTTGGFTFYSGAGIAISNGMIKAGYSKYSFTTGGSLRTAGGLGFRVAVLL
jgi:hypothetical protein